MKNIYIKKGEEMAVKDSYSRARATKKKASASFARGTMTASEKRQAEAKIKKSPILIVVILSLILGALSGFFAFKYLSPFNMNAYYVNGVASSETDYVVIDMSAIKEDYLKENPDADMEEIFNSITLKDDGFVCKFFGVDVSKSVTTTYYYREDISHDWSKVDGIDITTAGVYYIEYKSSHFAFKHSTLIRTIIVTEVENDG